jgi:hypothetical protein
MAKNPAKSSLQNPFAEVANRATKEVNPRSSRGHFLHFAQIWNDTDTYPNVADVAKKLNISVDYAKKRARRYLTTQRQHPEQNLPALLDREKTDLEKGLKVFHEDYLKTAEYRIDPEAFRQKRRFVITGAQYGANLNKQLFRSLQRYCADNDAALIVLPVKYGSYLEPLPKELKGMVCFEDIKLNKSFRINATASVRPTVLNPLAGREGTVDNCSEILASPRAALKYVPIANHDLPKVLMTTGTVTYPSYRFEGAGAKAERTHTFGAILVEIVNETVFHFRQLFADDKNGFCDINLKYYGPTGIKPAKVDSLVTGDWHVWQTSDLVRKATFGPGGMVERLRPSYIVFHDLFDGMSISHHEMHNHILLARRAEKGQLHLHNELMATVSEVAMFLQASYGAKLVVVRSNHDEHLDRYLTEERFMQDPHNTRIGMSLALKMLDSQMPLAAFVTEELAKSFSADELKARLRFLTRDDDFVRQGIRLDMHGDKGANGSRGSTKQFLKSCGKTVTGHAHTPMIDDAAFVVGTSTSLKLEYTVGLSSWCNTHCIVYENGQRQLINIINGAWC